MQSLLGAQPATKSIPQAIISNTTPQLTATLNRRRDISQRPAQLEPIGQLTQTMLEKSNNHYAESLYL